MAEAPSSPPAGRNSGLRALWLLLLRDLRAEARTKSLLTSMGLFALLEIVVIGLGVRALETGETYHRFVLAMLWVCTLFAAVVGLNRFATADREKGFAQALLLLPHDPALVYVARLISSFLFLAATQAVLVLVSVPLLKFSLLDEPLLAVIAVMTDLGVLAPGVLLASTTGQTRRGEALLAVALLPVTVPVFLCAAGASDALQGGLGFSGARPWLLLLLVCDAMFAALGLLLYGRLNEG